MNIQIQIQMNKVFKRVENLHTVCLQIQIQRLVAHLTQWKYVSKKVENLQTVCLQIQIQIQVKIQIQMQIQKQIQIQIQWKYVFKKVENLQTVCLQLFPNTNGPSEYLPRPSHSIMDQPKDLCLHIYEAFSSSLI